MWIVNDGWAWPSRSETTLIWHTVGDEEAGVCVPEVVKSDRRESRAAHDPSEELADGFRVECSSGRVGEDWGACSGRVALALLVALPLVEKLLGPGVEVDGSSAGARLGCELGGASVEGLAAAVDRESMVGRVPVSPVQPGEFAPAHPGGRCEVQRRVQPVRRSAAEEGAQLVGRPGLWPAVGLSLS